MLSCSCFTAIGNPTSFLVGNNAGVGDGNFKGPSTAAQVTFRYASTTNNLVFYKPTQLGPTGVKLRWEQLDTASGGGFLYCNASDRANPDGLMDIENAMVDSGKTYGGHKLFKTSVPGLYYTLFIAKLWSAYSTKTTISDSGLYVGDTTPQNSSGSSQTLIYNMTAAITRYGTIDSGPSAVLYTTLRLNFILIPILTLQQTSKYPYPAHRHIFMRLRPIVPVLVLLITVITFISTLIYSMLN